MRFVWWLATILAVSLVSIFLSEQGAADPVRNLSLTITSPVQGGLRDAVSPVNDIFSGITDGDLANENEQLRDQIEQLKAQLARQQDTQQRLEELQDAVGVKQKRPDDALTAANVIGEDTSGLRRFIAIDMGSGDGLDEGMVVLSRNGSLIGTIASVYKDFAWIRLITDPDSAVNAQVSASPLGGAPTADAPQVATPASPTAQASSTPPAAPSATPAPPAGEAVGTIKAVAKGDLRQGIEMDLIPSEAAMARGDLVVTSGHGGNYPRGLLLGTVNELDERPQAPFKSATVQPAADLSRLDTVLVLTSFKPARLTSP
jgi:rod shape-determining protein MreC